MSYSPPSSNRFNQILVLDSIPQGELNTARRLFEDLDTYAKAHGPSPTIVYLRIQTADDLFTLLSQCRQRAIHDDIYPLLHLECHGDVDGFTLADGTYAPWEELKVPLTELNVSMRLNLLITVAACTGAALAMVLRAGDRAPYWGLIGPSRTLSAGELEKAYLAFYTTLMRTKSSSEAMAALEGASEAGMFAAVSAQGLFDRVWQGYLDGHCTDEALVQRAQGIRAQLPPDAPHTIDDLKAILLAQGPITLQRFWKTFFMQDLYPDHVKRFAFRE